MFNKKKKAIKRVIEAIWDNPEGMEVRKSLFPEGKPTPDLFVKRMADYVRQQLPENYQIN